MPNASDVVWIDVLPSMARFGPTLARDAGTASDKAGRRSGSKFSDGFKRNLRLGAAIGGAMAVAAGTKFLKSAISEASDLGESLNAVNVTFGKNAEGIKRLGKEAADSVGLSNSEFNSLAVQFSAFAGTISGKGGDVVGTMKDLTTRGADFASVMNLDVNEAMGLFQSGLAGETEPLRRYGIDLSAAAVENHALAEGIAEAGAELTEQQKVQARYSLLMKSTSKVQGDFKNTSDSLANSQRILGANWDNIQATVGQRVIPALERLSGWALKEGLPALQNVGGTLKRVAGFVDDNSTALKTLAGVTVALIAVTKLHAAVMAVQAAGGLLAMLKATKLVTTATKTYTAFQWLLNAALTANPIGLVVAGIALLVAGLVIAYKKSETFRNIVNGVWEAVKTGAMTMVKGVVNGVLWMVEKVIGIMAKIPGPTQDAFLKAADAVKGFREKVNSELNAISDEDVTISLRADAVGKLSPKDFAMQFGGGGGRPGTGAYGGPTLRPRVNGTTGGVRDVASNIAGTTRELANAMATELAANYALPGRMGKAGSVLPRGRYSIGMPYLGYPGHYGADYPAATGTPVYALGNGTVDTARSLTTSYGKHVYLGHPGGIQTRYAHMNSLLVSSGQQVRAGQQIGTVGSTGNSTGPHLHFEYRRNGMAVNPASLGIFDRGGWLKPGMGGVNLSKDPEPVFTGGQWATLKAATRSSLVGSGSGGSSRGMAPQVSLAGLTLRANVDGLGDVMFRVAEDVAGNHRAHDSDRASAHYQGVGVD